MLLPKGGLASEVVSTPDALESDGTGPYDARGLPRHKSHCAT